MERYTKMKVLTFGLMVVLMALIIIGLATIYSTTSDYYGIQTFKSQCLWVGLGVVCCLVLAFLPLEWLAKYSWIILACVVLPLLYLACARLAYKYLPPEIHNNFPLVAGKIKGGFRWLSYSGYGFQPSEFAKFALLLFLSSYLGVLKRADIGRFVKGFVIPALISCVVLALVVLGEDLSTTCVTGAMVGTIMFCAGVKVRFLSILLGLGLGLVALMVTISPERLSRITSFRHAEEQAQGDGYQLYASQLALGGGGMRGRGYANSLMKMGYLRERHTDFILAVWGEEMGFVGMVAVLVCYLLLMVCLVGIGFMCNERTSMLICIGFCMLVTFQAIVNIGVISGWCPTTGLTAPFISYGGSSMLALMMCVGLVFNACLRIFRGMRERTAKGSQLPNYSELKSALTEDGKMVR